MIRKIKSFFNQQVMRDGKDPLLELINLLGFEFNEVPANHDLYLWGKKMHD